MGKGAKCQKARNCELWKEHGVVLQLFASCGLYLGQTRVVFASDDRTEPTYPEVVKLQISYPGCSELNRGIELTRYRYRIRLARRRRDAEKTRTAKEKADIPSTLSSASFSAPFCSSDNYF